MAVYAKMFSPIISIGILLSFVPLAGMVLIITGEKSGRKRWVYSMEWMIISMLVVLLLFLFTPGA